MYHIAVHTYRNKLIENDAQVPTYEAFGYRAVTKVHVDGMDDVSGFNQCQVMKEFA